MLTLTVQPLQLALARIGVETGIFSSLAGAEGSTLSNSKLAEKSKVEPILMSTHMNAVVMSHSS